MATIKRFEDIEAWQKARILAAEVYKISIETDLGRDFRFRDQVNASAGSVMDNIAEGFERGGKLELINFLTIAKGSCGEVRAQLYVALDQGYIAEDTYRLLDSKLIETSRMLSGLVKYLKQSELKGSKFK